MQKFNKEAILDKLDIKDFVPTPFATKGIQQTLLSYGLPYNALLDNKNLEKIPLADGDNIVVALNFPKTPQPIKRIVLLVHGLSGSYVSKYMIRMTKRLTRKGYLIARMNLRGTGPGMNHATKLYNGGMSTDISAVLVWLKLKYPNLPVTCAGFSLGANITLKLAGENIAKGNLDSVLAVSPPMDLYACVQLLAKPPNKFLDKHFANELVNEVTKMHNRLNKPIPCFPENLSVYDFDELYTAPENQFKNAREYYEQSSAINFLDNISLPTFILYAKNDPIIFSRKFKLIPNKPNFDVLITNNGGHMGWISKINPQGVRWMDYTLERWIEWFHSKNKVA